MLLCITDIADNARLKSTVHTNGCPWSVTLTERFVFLFGNYKTNCCRQQA